MAGLNTVADLGAIKEKLDLLILAVDASRAPEMIDDILEKKLAESVMLISGGRGNRKDSNTWWRKSRTRLLPPVVTSLKRQFFSGPTALASSPIRAIMMPCSSPTRNYRKIAAAIGAPSAW